MRKINDKIYLSTEEAAEKLGVCVETVRRSARKGEFAGAIRYGSRAGGYLILPESLKSYSDNRQVLA
jgi:excisionase family DNA binding protein